ncbi:ABC transporter permease [Amycolatopsis rubida]|uniref:ABC transporter permease n=1 Tax=Amycolatopsis rubida TaxID=112413 RepID=A0A1I5ZBR4_9PSEU|nr:MULTISPECIES: ABC transporter permease [Amycolatopsis]MYW90814.1 ABC transporter permease [Amycolatopsis rubida]NEC55797.1 ABC transporter permease [Amycolatopsis rubida]OAP26127.1 ABC-2 type transporter [Amycolatopsis sp. M39]SFQ53865.1 ABC-2 type transport system permease protein [Amycolatopsis rubida]
MTTLISTAAAWLRVGRAGSANAFADFKAMYTPVTWTCGWLTRILAQVAFYALIGRLLDSREQQEYLLVGAAMTVLVTELMLVCASTAWERRAGTLPLLIVAPVSWVPVFLGRSVQWIPSSLATSSVSLFVLGPLFGVRWTVLTGVLAFGALVVSCLSSYLFAFAMAVVVLNRPELRNLMGAVVSAVTSAVCGAVVPVGFWPLPVRWLAHLLPPTYGLDALRRLARGEVGVPLLADAGLAAGSGLAWLGVGALLLKLFLDSGRREGTLEFS